MLSVMTKSSKKPPNVAAGGTFEGMSFTKRMKIRMEKLSPENANVQNVYDSNLADFTPEQAAQWLKEQDEKEALRAEFHREDPLEQKVESDLQVDIIRALRSRHPRARLERVAKLHSLSYEGVREMAEALAAKVLNVNLEKLEFESVVKTVRWLEENVMNEGERLWRLGNLARAYKTTPKHLYRCYELDLVSREAIQPITMKELREQNSQSIPWLVQGWLPKASTVLLHADGGIGKTLFIYQVLQHVLEGTPWNGYLTEKGSVLLVQTDEPSRVCAERLDIRGIPDNAPLQVVTNFQSEHLPQLVRHIEEHQPSLVIIDSLTSINKACTFSENDTEYARPLLHLRDIANEHGCTVVIIHHSNADGRARGTRAIHNSVSEVWRLQNGEAVDERILAVEKTRGGRSPGRYKFRFDESDFSFTYIGEESLDNESELTMEEKIRLHLSQNPGVAYATDELSELLNLSTRHTRRLVREMWAKGLCQRTREGKNWLYHIDKSCWSPDEDASRTRGHDENSHVRVHVRVESPDTQGLQPFADIADMKNATFNQKIETKNTQNHVRDVREHSKPPSDKGLERGHERGHELDMDVRVSANGSSPPSEDEVWLTWSELDTAVKLEKRGKTRSQVYIPGTGSKWVNNDELTALEWHGPNGGEHV